MKQKAEKFLNTALGGNMNLATLKPLALIEIMTAFAEIEVAAINYTRCSLQLKSKNTISFEEWKKRFLVHLYDEMFELRGELINDKLK